MYLTQFEIENYRTIRANQKETLAVGGQVISGATYVTPFRIDTSFGLTLLVGPNGVGKSNILSALRFALSESSDERARDNRPINGSRRRSISVKTVFSALPSELDRCSEQTQALDFMTESKTRIAISRTLKESFTAKGRTASVSYAFSNHKKSYLDKQEDQLNDLENLCTHEHLLISLDTLPSWSLEGRYLLQNARESGIPADRLLALFNMIVNDELVLDIQFGSRPAISHTHLREIFQNSTDRFGENALSEQGRGVQATLVYALALSIIRLRAELSIGAGVTMLLEEPENGLHVALQRRLTESLDKSSKESMNCSIIITSNSPFLIPNSPDHRLFEIEENDSATIRKNFLRNSPVPRHWLESDDSMTEALWGLLESRSVARVLDLFRKFQDSNMNRVIIVEGYLDKLYIDTAMKFAEHDQVDFRVMISGESLELRRDNFEQAGVWLLALQVLLSYGWAGKQTMIRAVTDADEDGLLTARSVGYLASRIAEKARGENKLDIRISHTNFAEPSWENLYTENPSLGDIWISTEIEDLWPRSYLDKYFSKAPPQNMERRKSAIFVETSGRQIWEQIHVDAPQLHLPDELHPMTLSKFAKHRSSNSIFLFEEFIRETPPEKEEALVFLRRLTNILNSRPSFGDLKLKSSS